MASGRHVATRVEICPATDIYSLGAMLYEMLSRAVPPFQGATRAGHVNAGSPSGPGASVASRAAAVPRDLNTICLKCLEKDAVQALRDGSGIVRGSTPILEQRADPARPISWIGQGPRWMRRHQGLAVSLSVVALLLGLLVVGSFIATAHFRALERQQRCVGLGKGRACGSEGNRTQQSGHSQATRGGTEEKGRGAESRTAGESLFRPDESRPHMRHRRPAESVG